MNSQWSTTARNDRLAALNTAAATGFLDVYTGAQPATGDTAVSGTVLVSIALAATAFHTPSAGTMTNNGALSGVASATGTAGYCIIFASNHTTVLWMGSVGTSGANLNLSTLAISSGVTVSVADAAVTITDFGSISGY